MSDLLPSELARLILGYLESKGFLKSAESMLTELPELKEVAMQRMKGQKVKLRVGDYTLVDMINDYSHAKDIIYEVTEQYPSTFSRMKRIQSLREQVQCLTDLVTTKKHLYPSFYGKTPRKKKFATGAESLPRTSPNSCSISVSVADVNNGTLPSDSNNLFTNTALKSKSGSDCVSDGEKNLETEELLSNDREDSFHLSESSLPLDGDHIPGKRKGSVRKKNTPSPKNKQPIKVDLDPASKKLLEALMTDSSLHSKIADHINKYLQNHPTGIEKCQTVCDGREASSCNLLTSTNSQFHEGDGEIDVQHNSRSTFGLPDNIISNMSLEFANELMPLGISSLQASSSHRPVTLDVISEDCYVDSNPTSRVLTTPVPALSPANNLSLSFSAFNTLYTVDEMNQLPYPSNSLSFEHCVQSNFSQFDQNFVRKNMVETDYSDSGTAKTFTAAGENAPGRSPAGEPQTQQMQLNCVANVHEVAESEILIDPSCKNNTADNQCTAEYETPSPGYASNCTAAPADTICTNREEEYNGHMRVNASELQDSSSTKGDAGCHEDEKSDAVIEVTHENSRRADVPSAASSQLLASQDFQNQTPAERNAEATVNISSSGENERGCGDGNDAANEKLCEHIQFGKTVNNGNDVIGQPPIIANMPLGYSPAHQGLSPVKAVPVASQSMPNSIFFSGTPDRASNYTLTELTPLTPSADSLDNPVHPICTEQQHCEGNSLNNEQGIWPPTGELPIAKIKKVEFFTSAQDEANGLQTACIQTNVGDSIVTQLPSPDKAGGATITVISVPPNNPNQLKVLPKPMTDQPKSIEGDLHELKNGRKKRGKRNPKQQLKDLKKSKDTAKLFSSSQTIKKSILPRGSNTIIMEDDSGCTLVPTISEMGKKYTLPNCVSVSLPSAEDSVNKDHHITDSNDHSSDTEAVISGISKSSKVDGRSMVRRPKNTQDNKINNQRKPKARRKIKENSKSQLLEVALTTALREFSSEADNECDDDTGQSFRGNDILGKDIDDADKECDVIDCANDSDKNGDRIGATDACENYAKVDGDSASRSVAVCINQDMEYLVDQIENGLIDNLMHNQENTIADNEVNDTRDEGNLSSSIQNCSPRKKALLLFSESFTLPGVQNRCSTVSGASPLLTNRRHKGSFSTPRNKTHIRALDFSTPRKAFSSKKTVTKAKTNLSFNSPSPGKKPFMKRSGCQNLIIKYQGLFSGSKRAKLCQENLDTVAEESSKDPDSPVSSGVGVDSSVTLKVISEDLALSDESFSREDNEAVIPENERQNETLAGSSSTLPSTIETPGKGLEFAVCLEPATPYQQISAIKPAVLRSGELNTPVLTGLPITPGGKSPFIKAYPQGPYSDSSEGTYYQPSERSVSESERSVPDSGSYSPAHDDLETVLIRAAQKSEEHLAKLLQKKQLKKELHSSSDDVSPHLVNENGCRDKFTAYEVEATEANIGEKSRKRKRCSADTKELASKIKEQPGKGKEKVETKVRKDSARVSRLSANGSKSNKITNKAGGNVHNCVEKFVKLSNVVSNADEIIKYDEKVNNLGEIPSKSDEMVSKLNKTGNRPKGGVNKAKEKISTPRSKVEKSNVKISKAKKESRKAKQAVSVTNKRNKVTKGKLVRIANVSSDEDDDIPLSQRTFGKVLQAKGVQAQQRYKTNCKTYHDATCNEVHSAVNSEYLSDSKCSMITDHIKSPTKSALRKTMKMDKSKPAKSRSTNSVTYNSKVSTPGRRKTPKNSVKKSSNSLVDNKRKRLRVHDRTPKKTLKYSKTGNKSASDQLHVSLQEFEIEAVVSDSHNLVEGGTTTDNNRIRLEENEDGIGFRKRTVCESPGLTIEHIESVHSSEDRRSNNLRVDSVLPPVNVSLIKDILNKEFSNKLAEGTDDNIHHKKIKKTVFSNWGKDVCTTSGNKKSTQTPSSHLQNKWQVLGNYCSSKAAVSSGEKLQRKKDVRSVVNLSKNEGEPSSDGSCREDKSLDTNVKPTFVSEAMPSKSFQSDPRREGELENRLELININKETGQSLPKVSTDYLQPPKKRKFSPKSISTEEEEKGRVSEMGNGNKGDEYQEIERQLEALDGKVYNSPDLREGLRNDAELDLCDVFTPSNSRRNSEHLSTPRKSVQQSTTTISSLFDSGSKSSMMTFTPLPRRTPEKRVQEICQSFVKDGIGIVAFPSSLDELSRHQIDRTICLPQLNLNRQDAEMSSQCHNYVLTHGLDNDSSQDDREYSPGKHVSDKTNELNCDNSKLMAVAPVENKHAAKLQNNSNASEENDFEDDDESDVDTEDLIPVTLAFSPLFDLLTLNVSTSNSSVSAVRGRKQVTYKSVEPALTTRQSAHSLTTENLDRECHMASSHQMKTSSDQMEALAKYKVVEPNTIKDAYINACKNSASVDSSSESKIPHRNRLTCDKEMNSVRNANTNDRKSESRCPPETKNDTNMMNHTSNEPPLPCKDTVQSIRTDYTGLQSSYLYQDDEYMLHRAIPPTPGKDLFPLVQGKSSNSISSYKENLSTNQEKLKLVNSSCSNTKSVSARFDNEGGNYHYPHSTHGNHKKNKNVTDSSSGKKENSSCRQNKNRKEKPSEKPQDSKNYYEDNLCTEGSKSIKENLSCPENSHISGFIQKNSVNLKNEVNDIATTVKGKQSASGTPPPASTPCDEDSQSSNESEPKNDKEATSQLEIADDSHATLRRSERKRTMTPKLAAKYEAESESNRFPKPVRATKALDHFVKNLKTSDINSLISKLHPT